MLVPEHGVVHGKEKAYILQQFSWRPRAFQGGGCKSEELAIHLDQIRPSEITTATENLLPATSVEEAIFL